MMMYIHCLGLNHQTAQVSLRERLALTGEKTKEALVRLGGEFNSQPENITEVVILSTCNRVELYAVSPDPGTDALLGFLADVHGIHPGEFGQHLYHYVDSSAVHHLYQVAAGLDSLVLGEPQILGQVTRALELAQSQNSGGPILSRLFQTAIHAGKRAHTETHISRNPASISSLAASLAERSVPDLDQAQVVIVGAGEMAELAVESLRKRGVVRIMVVNRTLARASEFVGRWQAQVTTFEHLEEALESADILITSTGAPHTIIHPYHAAKIMQNRQNRPLVAIDIAVPRDIDPEFGSIPGVRLFDMDSLSQQLEQSLAERVQEVPQVEAILAQEESRFMEYFNTLDVLPLISHLSNQAEAIRQAELEKTLRRLPDLTEVEIERIDALTQALVKKLMNAPITRLRAESQCPSAPQYAMVVRTLFGLPGQDDVCDLSCEPCPLPSNYNTRP
jgi:glutamyl-tRNA reductase